LKIYTDLALCRIVLMICWDPSSRMRDLAMCRIDPNFET
jgi:ribosomal protein S14